MSTPVYEKSQAEGAPSDGKVPASSESTFVNDGNDNNNNPERIDTSVPPDPDAYHSPLSEAREKATRLNDDLALLEAVREVSRKSGGETGSSHHDTRSSFSRVSRRRVDEFDEVTNPLHERAAMFNLPENPHTELARLIKKLHNSSIIVRYLCYITPLVVLLLIPLLVGALKFKHANVGGVRLLYFSIWLEIFWLTLWAGRVCLGKIIITYV